MATPTTPPTQFAPGFGVTTPPPSRPFDEPESASRYLRGTLAAFSLRRGGASTSPSRPTTSPEEWRHGLAFVVMGWAQLALGVLLITRPRRWVLAAGIVGNAG